jgi:drug/metabolite transporter (DMT)-like permease
MKPAVMAAGTEARDPAVLAAALAAVTLWAATPVATKVAVEALDPVAAGLLRTQLAAVAAIGLILAARMTVPRGARLWGGLAVSALGGFVIFPVLFSIGMARTSAGHGALLIATAPLFTGLIAALLERRMPPGRWCLGATVAFAGVIFLVDERLDLAGAGATAAGDLLVFLSCIAAAAGYVAGARAARVLGTWPVILWALVLGGIVLLPTVPYAIGAYQAAEAGPRLWGALIYLSLISSVLGYGIWYWALARGGIGRVGAIQFAQPLIGLMLAVLALSEALTWPLAIAAALIVGGIALAQGPSPRTGTRGSDS